MSKFGSLAADVSAPFKVELIDPTTDDVIRDKQSERGRAAELQFVDGALRTTTGANDGAYTVITLERA